MIADIKPRKLYHPKEIAVILKCTKSCVYSLIKRKNLPFVKRPSKIRPYVSCCMVRGSDFMKWMAAQKEYAKYDDTINPDKWYSGAEAAYLLGINRVQIYPLVKRKENPLRGSWRPGEYGMKFLGSDLLNYKRPKLGRPRIYSLDMPMSIRPSVKRCRENTKKERLEIAYHREHSPKQREGIEI